MDNLIAIELIDTEHHDVVEPFLSILSSFREQVQQFYIFSSLADGLFLEQELQEFTIVQDVHPLYSCNQLHLFHTFSDYGFSSPTTNYLFKDLVSCFSIESGTEQDIEMALLQFDEHLIASNESIYFIDLQHHTLIEKIASAYKITIHFFELDK